MPEQVAVERPGCLEPLVAKISGWDDPAARLREAFPDLPEAPDPQTVFLKLRELRNTW